MPTLFLRYKTNLPKEIDVTIISKRIEELNIIACNKNIQFLKIISNEQ